MHTHFIPKCLSLFNKKLVLFLIVQNREASFHRRSLFRGRISGWHVTQQFTSQPIYGPDVRCATAHSFASQLGFLRKYQCRSKSQKYMQVHTNVFPPKNMCPDVALHQLLGLVYISTKHAYTILVHHCCWRLHHSCMDITPLRSSEPWMEPFLKLTRRSTDTSPKATDLSFSILKRARRYFGPLVLEGPARSTITSYNCRPF
jgi:hypothetical protein